jgi:hypothetical protein
MVYVVERYLPGLDQHALRRSPARLAGATANTPVTHLCSTIVPADEACFCQFEGPSAEVVADANRRAGVPFDRLVDAVAVTAATE